MRILLTFILLLTVHELYIENAQAQTKCENIDVYSQEYIEVWTIFIELVQSHPEIYSTDPASLSLDEYDMMQTDLMTLIQGLSQLSPPLALRETWAAEISYWATYVALLSSSSDFGPEYAGRTYGYTMESLGEHINRTTRLALGYCPIWQKTIDELNTLMEQ